MVEKHVQVVTQPSNRAKGKDEKEKKIVFKGMLDNPFRIQWPSISLNLQNAILGNLRQRLQGTSEYQRRRFTENRKRKRNQHLVSQTLGERQKTQTGLGDGDRGIDANPIRSSMSDTPLDNKPEQECIGPPLLFQHLVFGINEVTKRLEAQTRTASQLVVASWPDQPAEDLLPPLKYVFVCRNDVNPTVLVDHLPHLVAAYNASCPPSFAKLVPLPPGAEISLAQTLGIRRVTVLGIDTLYPEDPSLDPLLERVPLVTASWLRQPDTRFAPVPTQIKQFRTTAPKDMKAARELRCEERARAKQRHRSKQQMT